MPKEDSDVKKDILQLEKKMVDLEISVTELKESLKNIDLSSISELSQRVEDVEDLAMVEQAGIIELKKVLGEKPKEEVEVPSGLEDRIKKIEGELSGASATTPATPVEMESLYKKLEESERQLISLQQEVENLNKTSEEKLQEIEKRLHIVKPTVDFDLITARFNSLRSDIDSMNKKKFEMDIKLAEFEKKFEMVDSRLRGSLAEGMTEEIKTSRKDLLSTNIRIDSLERVSRNLISQVDNVENSLKKFESFEKMSFLSKEVEEKIERFKFIEGEMKRLSSRVEMMYQNIDERLDRVKDVERRMPEISDMLVKVNKDMDKIRIDMMDRTTKEELSRRLGEFKGRAEKEFPANIINQIRTFDKMLNDMEKRVNTIEGTYKKEGAPDLVDRISRLEEGQKIFERRILKGTFLDEQIKEFVGKIMLLESRLVAVEGMLRESSGPFPVILE